MENKKTISYLNSRAWYRFVKVLYVGIFCLVALLLIFILYKAQDNPKKYIIYCNWNNQSYIDGEKWADMPFSSDIGKWSKEERLSAAAGCLTNSERDIFHKKVEEFEKVVPPTYPSPGFAYDTDTFTNMNINALSTMEIDIYNNDSFGVTTPIETMSGIIKFLGIVIIALFIELFVFEAIRRVFYYVILGKIKPNKQLYEK